MNQIWPLKFHQKTSYVVYLEYYSDIDIAKQADEGLMIQMGEQWGIAQQAVITSSQIYDDVYGLLLAYQYGNEWRKAKEKSPRQALHLSRNLAPDAMMMGIGVGILK